MDHEGAGARHESARALAMLAAPWGAAAAGRCTAALGHALANLLQSVVGHAQLALAAQERAHARDDHAREDPELARDDLELARDDLELALDAACRARDLVRQLAQLAPLLGGGECGLGPRAREAVLAVARASVPRGGTLAIDGEELLEAIDVDAGLVAWLLVDLATIAQRALARAGAVEIALARRDAGARSVIVLRVVARALPGESAPAAGGAADVERELARARAIADELGLALSVARGEALAFERGQTLAPEQGEALALELAAPARGAAERAPKPDRPCVLHVEEDGDVARRVGEMLVSRGWTVARAAGALDALAFVERARERVDVVLADESLSELPAHALARELALLAPALPVVLASGFADAPEDGAPLAGRVAKPYVADALDEALRAAVRGARAHPGADAR